MMAVFIKVYPVKLFLVKISSSEVHSRNNLFDHHSFFVFFIVPAIPATLKRKRKKKTRGSYPNSPSSSDLEGRPVAASAKDSGPETIRDRLRYLADSWAGVNIPEKCGQIQTIACSSLLVWLIDNQDQVYYSPAAMTSHAYYTWKKLESKAMHISTNQNGSIVWCIDRNGVAHYRVGIKETAPQGIFNISF